MHWGAAQFASLPLEYKAMTQQENDSLLLIKKVRKELHGKVGQSVLLELDQLIAQLENDQARSDSIDRHDNKQIILKALDLLARCLPWVKSFLDGM